MLLRVPEVLSPDALRRCREAVLRGPWENGRATAGTQSEQTKNNRQLPEECAASREARGIVLEGLSRSPLFFTAALPERIFPPLFNRYGGASNAFGNHIDNAMRTPAAGGERVRTDLSATLFLTDPADYDGGELVVEDHFGTHAVKLAAGDLVAIEITGIGRLSNLVEQVG